MDTYSRVLLLRQIWQEQWTEAADSLRQLAVGDAQLVWALGNWDDRRIGRMAQVALTGSSNRDESARIECRVKDLTRLAWIADRLHLRKFSHEGKLHLLVPTIARYCGLAHDLATSPPLYTEQDLRNSEHSQFSSKTGCYDPTALRQVMTLCAEEVDGIEDALQGIEPRLQPLAVSYVLTVGEQSRAYRRRLLSCSVRVFSRAQHRQLFENLERHPTGVPLLCSALRSPEYLPIAHDVMRFLQAETLLKIHLAAKNAWSERRLRQVLFHSLRGPAGVSLKADRSSLFTGCDKLVQVHIATFLKDRDLCAYRASCRAFYLNTRELCQPVDGLLGEAVASMRPDLPQVNLDLVKRLFSPPQQSDRGGYFRLAVATLPDEYLRRLPELLDWVPKELTDAIDCKHEWKDLTNFNGTGLRLPVSLMIRQCRKTGEQWNLLDWLLRQKVYLSPPIDALIEAFVTAETLERFNQAFEGAGPSESIDRARRHLTEIKGDLATTKIRN